ncbi:hypothetical protein AVEN_274691-1, partial [Araneus ventricosus]
MLIPQQLRWDFIPSGHDGRPSRAQQIYQCETGFLGCNFRLYISGTTIGTDLRLLLYPLK